MAVEIDELRRYVRASLSLPRFLHTLRTSGMMVQFAERFGVSLEEAEIAALAHDMARELPEHDMIRIAEEDGFPILSEEAERPVLLHGRASAVLLNRLWNEKRENILYAVRRHTQGDRDMGLLGMLLFVADYIEPGRTHISEEFRRGVLKMNMPQRMVMRVIEDEMKYLDEKRIPVSERTMRLIVHIKEEMYAVTEN
ncbi:MAG: bis(5'-nucleosyl)-tetraphosphatase (symmetrical) YqeK [Sediminispirochaetaceae bacterium]